MKFLGKINRGLILTLVILIAVFIYLMTQSILQSGVKPEIKDLCERYIKTAINYKELPGEYKKENPEIPQVELNKYIDDMTRDLQAFYTDNEQSSKYVIRNYKTDLENQAKGKGIVFSYKKDIKEYKKFIFAGNAVTVIILTDTVLDGPNIFMPGMPREKIASQTTDTISLQKIDGEWKISYADLQQPMNKQNGNGMMTYRTVSN